MKKLGCFFILFIIAQLNITYSQPWRNPLLIAYSSDGISFGTPVIFQDSSGVPSAIKWKGDTLISVFQWFRQPINSNTWDKVAVKFSYDNGSTWTVSAPIIVNGIPVSYQRPFDPTIALIQNDSLRIYFSSSDGMPQPGGDSIINTYSAKSGDGINYYFEPGARVDNPISRVIDPAVIYFNNSWHYIAPIGSPQQGAFHYISPDGLNFTQVADISSDPQHNWTGNFVVNAPGDLRFYGSGMPNIWFNSSPNGGVWNGYVNINIAGGDPTAVKISNTNYLMIFVGAAYNAIRKLHTTAESFSLYQNYPNPFNPVTKIQFSVPSSQFVVIKIFDVTGREVATLVKEQLQPGTYEVEWAAANFPSGVYFYRIAIYSDKLISTGASTPLSTSFTETKRMVLVK